MGCGTSKLPSTEPVAPAYGRRDDAGKDLSTGSGRSGAVSGLPSEYTLAAGSRPSSVSEKRTMPEMSEVGDSYRDNRDSVAESRGTLVGGGHSPTGVTIRNTGASHLDDPSDPAGASRAGAAASASSSRADPGRPRKGSVEAAMPAQKRGAGGEVNVAAALRSKRRGQIMAQSQAVDLRIHKPVFDKDKAVRTMIAGALKENVLTSTLGPDVIRDLINATQPRDVEAGAVIITQGDVGDNFYVIERGRFDIIVNGTKVATFGDGTTNKSFGELALLFNSPRAATVTASSKGRLWWLGRDTFRGLVATSSHEEHGRMKAALGRGVLSGLDTEQLEQVAAAATRVRFNDGDQIIRKGAEGNVFYVIDRGEVLCTNIGGGQSDNLLAAGDYFGERALLKDLPRAADVFAKGDADLIALSREDFEAQLGSLAGVLEHNLGLRLLLCVPFLASLTDDVRTKLFKELRLVQYKAGKAIVKPGRIPKRFCIVKEGTVQVHPTADSKAAAAAASGAGRGDEDEDDDKTLLPGQWFGEAEILSGSPATAAVLAISPVQCFELEAETFRKILGGVPELADSPTPVAAKRKISAEAASHAHSLRPAASAVAAKHRSGLSAVRSGASGLGAAASDAADGARVHRRAKRTRREMLKLNFADLEQRATLGTGTFGRVRLVVHRPTGAVYALKALQKAQIVALNQQKNVIREKEILAVINHPFVIKLYQTFKDQHRLYMLLEMVQGGELFSRMQASEHKGVEGVLAEQDSCFYAAGVADALVHLHERNIVYRDLKPENLLIDALGYVKVVDFGFAKVIRDRSYTLCGTPEYLAPELISGKGHNRGVDYWALGILIFEMACGFTPFMDDDDDQLRIARNIIRKDLEFPSFVTSKPLKDIVKRLLTRDLARRLGMLRGGASEIKYHPFFASIDWDDLLACRIETPWQPTIRGKDDTGCFDEYDEDERLERYFPARGADPWDKDF